MPSHGSELIFKPYISLIILLEEHLNWLKKYLQSNANKEKLHLTCKYFMIFLTRSYLIKILIQIDSKNATRFQDELIKLYIKYTSVSYL